jgi:hypothetical protein
MQIPDDPLQVNFPSQRRSRHQRDFVARGSSTGNAISIDRPSGLTAIKTILCLQFHGSRYRGNVALCLAHSIALSRGDMMLSGFNSTSIPAGLVSDRAGSTHKRDYKHQNDDRKMPQVFPAVEASPIPLRVTLLPQMPWLFAPTQSPYAVLLGMIGNLKPGPIHVSRCRFSLINVVAAFLVAKSSRPFPFCVFCDLGTYAAACCL